MPLHYDKLTYIAASIGEAGRTRIFSIKTCDTELLSVWLAATLHKRGRTLLKNAMDLIYVRIAAVPPKFGDLRRIKMLSKANAQ